MLTAVLASGAFLLGAIPFSVIVGRLVLGKDITRYGDANPGAANVVRAGSFWLGFCCVLLDLGKGVPVLLAARLYFDLPPISLIIIGASSMLGHGYSPFLKFKGGKGVSVTFGTLIGMLEIPMLFPFTAFVVAGAISLKNHSWAVMLGPIGTLIFLIITGASGWEVVYILIILAFFIIKHNQLLLDSPGLRSPISNALTNLGARFRS